ncbi:tRNA-guanine transglycosylase [Leptolinea sp. HRD-7]|nr:tRNA-guanine transglycosylase [Leptolinea sp. HRD-7]
MGIGWKSPYNSGVTSTIDLQHGQLTLPVYMPDSTQAVVRSVDSIDLEAVKIQSVVMNAFHLMQHPGSMTVQSLGGLHRMAGWNRPIITDSGGFQAYSLIRQNSKYGRLGNDGIIFQPEGSNRKINLTPEKSIQLQVGFGADVVICLDDCTDVDASRAEQETSIKRTIDWAKRARREFDRQMDQRKIPADKRPLIFGVIQGGAEEDLRKECASALLDIGFDGFGYGGWPIDNAGALVEDIISLTRSLVPEKFPMHALGIGHPLNLAACWRLGYGLFDCAMPTRDARHGRLYAFEEGYSPEKHSLMNSKNWLDYIYCTDDRFMRDSRPVSEGCDCPVCSRYSRGYLHHLFKIGDSTYQRLATLHNLRFMTRLCELLR